jgi:hypothetical protein
VVEPLPASLLAALADLVSWLDSVQQSSMVIGGVAASALGRPRLTQDIDVLALIREEDWESCVLAAQRFGIAPRIPDAIGFAHRARVLLLHHSASGIDLDIVIGGLQFEVEACGHSRVYDIGGVKVRLPRVEDLLIMKAVARRPKDLQDIEGLLDAHRDLDLALVRRWVGEFAAATAMPDMIEELERLLSRRAR